MSRARLLLILLLGAGPLCILAGCNTVQGMGEDIQIAGEAVENAFTPDN